MIVMKAFTHCEESQPLQIGGTVVVGTATEMMAKCVYRRISSQIDIRVNEGSEKACPRPEKNHEDCNS